MSAYSDAVLADSPFVYYRLGETSGTTIADSSGNGRGATASASLPPGGSASLLPADADNGSITFDRTSALGPLGAKNSAGYDTPPLTAEFWIKPVDLTADASSVDVVLSCENAGQGWTPYYAPTTGVWHMVIQGSTDATFTATAVAGVTQHIVFVISTVPDVSLYINGVFQQTVATGVMNSSGNFYPISIARQNDNAHPCRATFDEVAVYTTALSAARISAHYAAATAYLAGVNFLRKGDRRS